MQEKIQNGWWQFWIILMIDNGSLVKRMAIDIMFNLISLTWSKDKNALTKSGWCFHFLFLSQIF